MPKGVFVRTEKHRESNRKAQNRPEVKKKISEAIEGEKNYNWKGGSYDWYHKLARELFGTLVCQECKITLQEYTLTHKRKKHFDMHCISKDYKILEQWNWKCLCTKCHSKEHEPEIENTHWSKGLKYEQTKEKIGKALKGKNRKLKSEETKRRMKEAWSRRKLKRGDICKI